MKPSRPASPTAGFFAADKKLAERDVERQWQRLPAPPPLPFRKRLLLLPLLLSLTMFTVLRNSLTTTSSRHWSGAVAGAGCRYPGFVPGANASGKALPSHFTLPSGDLIPSVALGVWQASPGEVGAAVTAALAAGYRHIDDAWIYRNEAEVGAAIAASGVPRKDIWITSKLWNNFHAPEDVEPALDESLARLDTDYLDLYIIHWPVAFKKNETTKDGGPIVDEGLTADPYPTWKKLEELVAKGKVRNIGVSNFNIARLENLTANALAIPPAVNQVELSFWNPQPDLLAYARGRGLLLEAYSPLGGARQVGATLRVPQVLATAAALGITPAQVVISWSVQRGTVVLPKSVTPARVVENFAVTRLPDDLFDELERAAVAHKPQRVVNPSKGWGLGYDVFDDYPYNN